MNKTTITEERNQRHLIPATIISIAIIMAITFSGLYFIYNEVVIASDTEMETSLPSNIAPKNYLLTQKDLIDMSPIIEPVKKESSIQTSEPAIVAQEEPLDFQRLSSDRFFINQAFKKFLRTLENDTLISFEGLAYSQQLQRIITIHDLNIQSGDHLIMPLDDYTIFYSKTNGMKLGLSYTDKTIVVGREDYQSFPTLWDARKALSENTISTFVTGTRLRRGDKDRLAIAETVRDFNNEEELIYIRHLSSDGEWAYLICSNYSSYQKVDQYILRKTKYAWEIMKRYDAKANVAETITNDVPEFNFLLLPSYTPSAFRVDDLSDSEITDLTNTLIEKGYIRGKPEVKYLTAIEQYIYVLYEDGQRVFIVMDEYKGDTFKEVLCIDGKSSKTHYLLNQYSDTNQLPYHIFLQE